MDRFLISIHALGALLFLVLPSAVEAQQDTEVCAPAEASLGRATDMKSYHRAIGSLVGCPVAGPRALATQWAPPPVDTTALRLLGDASATLRDRRLLRAAKSAALSRSNSRDVRLTAIRALVGQFHPSLDVVYRTPSEPGLGGVAYVMLAESDHRTDRAGAEPLAASGQDEVLNVLRQLGASDGDEVIRKVSAYLVGRLPSFGGAK
jgi:hypothetical protein